MQFVNMLKHIWEWYAQAAPENSLQSDFTHLNLSFTNITVVIWIYNDMISIIF